MDGVARIEDVTRFSSTELAWLSRTAHVTASQDVIQPVASVPLNFSDPRSRIRFERETVPLVQCFGVEHFARRVVGTAQCLQRVLNYAQALERPSPGGAAHIQVGQLSAEINRLTVELKRERERHAQEMRDYQGSHQYDAAAAGREQVVRGELQAAEAQLNFQLSENKKLRAQLRAEPPAPPPASSPDRLLRAEVQALTKRLDDVQAENQALCGQLKKCGSDLAACQSTLHASDVYTTQLKHQLLSAVPFSAEALMNFLMANCSASGHWARLYELLQRFQSQTDVPASFRTTLQISARDQTSDDCGPYVPLNTADPVPSPASAIVLSAAASTLTSLLGSAVPPAASATSAQVTTSVPIQTQASAQPSSTLAQPKATSTAKPSKKKNKKPSSARTPSLSSARKAGGKVAKTPAQPSKSSGLLAASSTSPSKHLRIKRINDRMSLPGYPSSHSPQKVRASKESPELMRAGVDFWDAVDQAGKSQLLHDQFGKKALVSMLVSAIYWEQLDSTPWLAYVPSAYYEAAIKRVRDVHLSQRPPNWDPLPEKPSPEDEDDDSSIDTDFSDVDDDADDDDDELGSGGHYQVKSSKSARTLAPQQISARSSGRSKAGLAARPDDGVIEEPQPGQGSWLHYGIRVQDLPRQTFGFPRYAPCKSHIQHLHQRWEPVEYLELLKTKPWDAMWNQRIQTLVFFRCHDLGPVMVRALKRVVNFMSLWRRAYWERLHWVTMDTRFDYEAMAALLGIPELVDLYRDRKERSAEFEVRRRELMEDLGRVKGYTDDIWYEPGLWVVPHDPCHWILRDPSRQISLPDQLETLDDAEPARTQFATRSSDDAFLDLALVELQRDPLDDEERAQNPIDPSIIYDQDELESFGEPSAPPRRGG
ncbi:Dual specificity protein kinase shkA [Phytophthora cinnamomi]|uniref:Dual specificity protein kinase shkA n=1 Tax=Phytophthora cinnamomi TaxID=4785 RepID=UPI0035599238|nr:Dual specificity protein kinase shkA [Phytophthora cinnamomi]